MPSEPTYPCPECQFGTLRGRRAFYFTQVRGQPVCIPDFPARICDFCGYREYDPQALANLHAMLWSSRPIGRAQRALRTDADGKTAPAKPDPPRRP